MDKNFKLCKEDITKNIHRRQNSPCELHYKMYEGVEI
jgi:hypothetical protein